MSMFIAISIFLYGFWFLVWSKKDMYNLMIKLLFLLMFIWGIFVALSDTGFVEVKFNVKSHATVAVNATNVVDNIEQE